MRTKALRPGIAYLLRRNEMIKFVKSIDNISKYQCGKLPKHAKKN